MSQSIRFLGFAILAWAGVRAVSLGLVPGTEALAFDLPVNVAHRPGGKLPALQPSPLPPIDMMASAAPMQSPPWPAGPQPIYLSIADSGRAQPPQIIYVTAPTAEAPHISVYGGPPPMGAEPARLAMVEQLPSAQPRPEWRSTPALDQPARPAKLDRLSLSSWAMLRDQAGAEGLAGGGTLGGSQAGARLLWRVNPHLAASLRTSSPINSQRGGEAALGARYQPFSSWPIAFTAERRQSIGRYGGRNAFAAFAEGGLYGQSMPLGSTLDAYLQAGIVGSRRRDWFVDGSAAVTRPVWRNFSGGVGMWGGAQPGLRRLDIGPRASMKVNGKVRVHLDYRQRLIGNAAPGSGGVVTIAGDF